MHGPLRQSRVAQGEQEEREVVEEEARKVKEKDYEKLLCKHKNLNLTL